MDDELKELAYDSGSFFLIEYGTASATSSWLRKFADSVAAREREACAALADEVVEGKRWFNDLPAAIRARGEK
jgi:hypothetical protein